MRYKPTILIDLDGVLNEYKGDYDENFIPDVKQGAEDFLKKLVSDYKLYLFTTRNIQSAKKWLADNNIEQYFEDVTNTKIPSYLIIDDRGLRFDGSFEKVLDEIKNFRVWYKINK